MYSGARLEALKHARSSDIDEYKRKFLNASIVDGAGGSHSTAVRMWVLWHAWGRFDSPFPDRLDVSRATQLCWENRLEDFLIWLFVFKPNRRFVSGNTLLKYASTVRAFVNREYSVQLGLGARNGRIPDMVKGMKRLVDHPPPRERFGISPKQLAASWDAFGASQMWRAITAFALAALARGAEVALDGKEIFDEQQHLTARDVVLFKHRGLMHARVQMRKRKDLQILRGKHATVVISGGGLMFDAVRELAAWLLERREKGISEDAPLFCWSNGDGITVAQLRGMVKALMESIGLDPSKYGAHSLRIGGATAALAAGVSPQLIRLMGRWSSDIYEIYCRMSLQAALGVGLAITSAEVDSFESGFHDEILELQPEELSFFARAQADDDEDVVDDLSEDEYV